MVSELKNVIERKGEKMGIKKFLKKSHLTKGIYQQLQRKKNLNIQGNLLTVKKIVKIYVSY